MGENKPIREIETTIDEIEGLVINIGRVYENKVTKLLVDLSSTLVEHPNATASLVVRQPNWQSYPATVTLNGMTLEWLITDAEIGLQSGTGEIQITVADGEQIYKSAIAQTVILPSILYKSGSIPDPIAHWISQAQAELEKTKEALNTAQNFIADLKQKLDNGELNGKPGPQGEKGEPGKDAPQEAVLYTAQTLDDAQKAQARENIGAVDAARQNILVGTETGNPIAVDDAFAAPLRGLTVYGRSTQDGTPTPDAPVPIVSAGDGGSVAVKVTGKNLLQGVRRVLSPSEVIEGGVKIVNIVNSTDRNSRLAFFTAELKKGVQYTISYKEKLVQGADIRVSVYLPDIRQFVTKTFIPKQDTNTLGIYLNPDEIGTVEVTDIQLELGTTATVYEPYREQLLTLPTPNGLPGIPVTSGGNYTDPSGQQWVCDEVDLERGVRVQRVCIKALSPDIAWSHRKTNSGNNNFQVRIYNADVASIRKPCFCNILRYTGNGRDDIPQNLPKIYANDQEITISFPPNSEYSSLEAFKQLLTNVKSVIYYTLATPIETPLTPAELAAYKALTTYAPDTVAQASDSAGLKLDYQRDVSIVIKNLEDAIASMTTT